MDDSFFPEARFLTDGSGRTVADPRGTTPEESGEWLIAELEKEATLQGRALTELEHWVLRHAPWEFTDDLHAPVVELNNRGVELARDAIVRAKGTGSPTVKVRRGLVIPVDWENHYGVVYSTELPWFVSHIMQSAFLGNPAVGERRPWKSR